MKSGQVMHQIEYEQNLHYISFTPIHTSIQRIIPFLEQRQLATKRLYQFKDKLTDAEVISYEELIKYCEREIATLLNFISEINHQ